MLRYLLMISVIVLISCKEGVTIDSTSEKTYQASLAEMKKGLSDAEIIQLNFSLSTIGMSSIPSASNFMAEVQDPKQYTMDIVNGKNRNQINKLAKKLIEKRSAQFK